MRPMPTWGGSTAAGRPGGGAACARLSSRTGGRQPSAIAQMAASALMTVAKQFAPATTWPTTIQKWQQNGTGRPMGKGRQRPWQQAATSKQPGGVASVGTGGAPLCSAEQRSEPLNAPSVPVQPVASRQGSPASVKEHHTCWLSGTGMPMRHMAGTQTMLENSGLREAGALVQFHSIASSAQVPCPNHLSRF